MARRRETTTTTTAHGRIQALLALACAAAAGMSGGAHAFVVGGAGGCSSGAGSCHQPHITRLASPSGLPLVARPAATTGGDGGGVDGLYTNATPDPNRRVLRLAFLAASRPKVAPKSDKEKKLDTKVWGRWKLVEESIDRPDPEDLKKYGAKLKPTYSHFEEDLVFDMWGTVMLTKPDTTAYGLGWAWDGMSVRDVYSAPTLKFRINRKAVGIEFDEYDDVNDCPSVSFYEGTFVDGDMDVIEGVIQRNRDVGPPKEGQPKVVVNVGTFRLVKVADYQL